MRYIDERWEGRTRNNYKKSYSSTESSVSPPPPPRGRKRRRNYNEYSSSDFTSDSSISRGRSRGDEDDDDGRKQSKGRNSSSDFSQSSSNGSPPPPRNRITKPDNNISIKGEPFKKYSLALGRRLDLIREFAVLRRDCQFVKKIVVDPAIDAEGNTRDRPIYVTGETISQSEGGQVDPRLPKKEYLEKCQSKLVSLDGYGPVVFFWDINSVGKPPPTTVLLAGLPTSIISKALLVNLISAVLDPSLAEAITDVQLGPNIALLSMQDPIKSSQLVKRLSKKVIGGAEEWKASFDLEGQNFKKLVRKTKLEPVEVAVEPLKFPPSIIPPPLDNSGLRLECSSKVPCILIDYAVIPKYESRQTIKDCFRKCHIYNVERGENHWHLHLTSQYEVDLANRWRRGFRWKYEMINFTIKLFTDGNLKSYNFKGEKSHGDFNGLGRGGGASSSVRKGSSNERKYKKTFCLFKPFKTPLELDDSKAVTSSNGGKVDSRGGGGDLEAFYRPSLPTLMENLLSNTSMSEQPTTDISSLPIFNRRILERRRAEEQAAALELQRAAEEARLALEKRITDEAVRREKRQERKYQQRRRIHRQSLVSSLLDWNEDIELPFLTEHQSGSARTEGFYHQLSSEKIVYLEDVTNSTRPIFDPAMVKMNTTTTSSSASRSNRAVNRRLQLSLEKVNSDLFAKTTAFTARKKKLALGRSSIHSWGLFSGEDIESGDMVIEYVGEIIRHTVANVREKRYELALRAKGSDEMASSYFFRLDDMYVVDATNKGNLSRFVNHSCDPTCVAKILNVDGTRRIVMYARRDIRRGEEITYDYKFPREDDPEKKIRCLCGTRTCRGALN